MWSRRHFLAAAAVGSASRVLHARAEAPDAPLSLSLWPGAPPGGGGPACPDSVCPPDISPQGAWRSIARPSLTVVAPARPTGAAFLIAAGGGYRRIGIEKEAWPAARWLSARGVTAFILAYRLPAEGWGAGALAPLQDAQRAIRLIRSRARRFGLDPRRIGALGFSAGGHLVGMAAARGTFRAYEPADAVDAASPRPDFVALAYPVVTLEPPYDGTSTRRVLIGEQPNPAQSAAWSVQTHVERDFPPLFLTQAKDDPISAFANSEILDAACRRAGVPVEWRPLADGGHGFAMGRPGTASMDWPSFFEAWLKRNGLLEPAAKKHKRHFATGRL